jgi:hypothetical protein
MMNTAACRAIENIRALDQRDALVLADGIVNDMIVALQRDRNIPSKSFTEWELILANLRGRIGERIAHEITGCVSLSEVLLEIEAATDWQELFKGDEITALFDGPFDGGES